VGTSAAALTLSGGCSNADQPVAVDAAFDHARVILPLDAGTPYEAGADAEVLRTSLRVALLSPLGFGVDVCVRAGANAPYTGPLLNQLPSLPDAGQDAPKSVDAGAKTPDSGPRRADGGADGAPLDASGAEAAEGDSGSPRDATLPTDAPQDARVDTGGDGATAAADGALADAHTDVAPSVDGGERVGGVTPLRMSTYVTIAGAGTFDVAIVLGGSTSCNSPLAIQRVTLDAGKLSTLVVLSTTAPDPLDGGADAARSLDAGKDAATNGVTGEAGAPDASGPALSIVVLTDEPALSATAARARFFNATSAGATSQLGALEVAALEPSATGPTTVPLAREVLFHRASSPNPAAPAVDSLGYWSGPPLVSTAPTTLVIGPAARLTEDGGVDGGTDGGRSRASWTFASPTTFDLFASSNHTGFILGGAATPISLLWCDDTTPWSAVFTSCASLSPE